MPEPNEMNASDSNVVGIHMACDNSKVRRLRSLVWNDFTKERKDDGNYVAICNHCKKQLTASSRSGTTHLKNHLASCTSTKPRRRKKLVVRRLLLKDAKNDGTNFDHSQFDQELSRQDLARMVVLHGYPFAIVHQVGFRTFVRNLQPQFKLMSEDEVKDDCMKIYETEKVKLLQVLEKLSCRVSLTVNLCTTGEGVEYMSLTCHFVDDEWRLKRKILNFLHVESPLSGEEITKTIAEKLHEWNISRKLFSIALDECSDSDVVASELRNFASLKGSLPLDGALFHVRCAASILGNIVHDIMGIAGEIITRVRDSVQYVNSSKARLNEFYNVARSVEAPQKPLVLDVPNNWGSTYLMLETACEFQHVFMCYASDYADSLSSEDWVVVKAVTECLGVFHDAVEKFPGTGIVTTHLYFIDICEIHQQLKKWRTGPLPLVASMASQIFENFEQYLGETGLVMALASVLDPRYKMRSIEYFFKLLYDDTSEGNARIENIRKCLVDLYDEYALQSNTIKSEAFLCYVGGSSGSTTNDWKTGEESKTPSRVTLSDARRGLDRYLQETSSTQLQKSDLDLYLDEPVCPSRGVDILAWWKFYAPKYPVLSVMARDILGIPMSPVALDYEDRTNNQCSSSMDLMTIQGMICGHDWLRDEFEVQIAPTEPSATISATISSAANMDVDVDECMVPAYGDELSSLSKQECN